MNAFLKTLLGQIGGQTLVALSNGLVQADYSALGQYKTVAQAGALLFTELAGALNAKWNPPAPAAPAAAANPVAGT